MPQPPLQDSLDHNPAVLTQIESHVSSADCRAVTMEEVGVFSSPLKRLLRDNKVANPDRCCHHDHPQVELMRGAGGCGAKIDKNILSRVLRNSGVSDPCGDWIAAFPFDLITSGSGNEDAAVIKFPRFDRNELNDHVKAKKKRVQALIDGGTEVHFDIGETIITRPAHLSLTVDFFPPPVNCPYLYGRIAAANAISDALAMGHDPAVCLVHMQWPLAVNTTEPEGVEDRLVLRPTDESVTREVTRTENWMQTEACLELVMKGVKAVCDETRCVVGGGHSICAATPAVGLSVLGYGERALRNNTCVVGDQLFVTKPFGMALTMKNSEVFVMNEVAIARSMMASTSRIPNHVRELMTSCTDITGFGVVGHLTEMLAGREDMGIRLTHLPSFLERDDERIFSMDESCGGARNRRRDGRFIEWDIDAEDLCYKDRELCVATRKRFAQLVLFDPATSGPICFSLPKNVNSFLIKKAWGGYLEYIGHVVKDPSRKITVAI